MSTLYVMQTGRTTWEDQARVESTAGASLTDQGAQKVQDIANELRNRKIGVVYASEGEAERQTATLAAKILGLKVRTDTNLRELDYGLWQGLTIEEIKRRQPKRHRQWMESPASVCPPGGETLSDAQQRLRHAVREILKRQKGVSFLLVLRPVMVGLLRCLLSGEEIDTLWSHVDPALTWEEHSADERNL